MRHLSTWPVLPALDQWKSTLDTVHMWTQVVGKIRLRLGPWVNHSWGSALYVTTHGLTTSPIPLGDRSFAIDLDFIHHRLEIAVSDGQGTSFPLRSVSVAGFYKQLMASLGSLGIEARIFTRPVEVEEAIRFEEDEVHRSYDGEAVQRYWGALAQSNRVFHDFRSRFSGKVSPVHFFWGAFDLAVTRFSGRTAPKHPGGAPNCADWVMEEAYSHEVSSAGFWPGQGFGEAAYYSYAYPSPRGYAEYAVAPAEAEFHAGLGEFVLSYEAVRRSADPDGALLSFLETTYAAAADLAQWDRQALDYTPPGALGG